MRKKIITAIIFVAVFVGIAFLSLWLADVIGIQDTFLKLVNSIMSPTVVYVGIIVGAFVWFVNKFSEEISESINRLKSIAGLKLYKQQPASESEPAATTSLKKGKVDEGLTAKDLEPEISELTSRVKKIGGEGIEIYPQDSTSEREPAATTSLKKGKADEESTAKDLAPDAAAASKENGGVKSTTETPSADNTFAETEEKEKAKDIKAQFNLGEMYYYGRGIQQDYAEAAKWFQYAANRGHAKAQFNLGMMYYYGRDIQQDYAEAAKWFQLAAEREDAKAQFGLGIMYYYGRGVKQDYAKAVKWLQCAANQGDARAQFNLGLMYGSGQGIQQDYAEAEKWYRCAAQQEYAIAQHNLGVMYANGIGVKQDYAEAGKWFQHAAEQGVASAQNNLGSTYYNGRGIKQDYAEAERWYRRAAQQEYAIAQYNLGLMYHNGQGVKQDSVEAGKWFRLAANQGYAKAQFNLGVMYHNGKGVAQNHREAYIWHSIAAGNGYEQSVKYRDDDARLLSANDLATAQAEAKLLMEKIRKKQAKNEE